MGDIYVSPAAQTLSALYSILAGVAGGVVYDLFRLIYAVSSAFFGGAVCRRVIRAACDVLFSIVYSAMAVVLVYAANGGIVRYYMILFFFSGSALYLLIIGRFTKKAEARLTEAIKALLKLLASFAKRVYEPVYKRLLQRRVMRYIMKKIK